VVRDRVSRADGVRDSQEAKHSPFSANAAAVAFLARANASVRGPSISSVTDSLSIVESIR
jgi:hypothetical protein